MNTPIVITNRLEYKTLYSDCTYPDLVSNNRQLKRVVVIDPEHVRFKLKYTMGADKIANKYAVNVENMIWYQHDAETWLLERVTCKVIKTF
jgi:hypothetical protein